MASAYIKAKSKRLVNQLLASLDPNSAFMKEHGHNEELLTDYLKFMIIKADGHDYDAELYSPSDEVDGVWHDHILDTKHYFAFCDLLGGYIHHNPLGAINDEENREIRLSNTREAYFRLFDDDHNENVYTDRKHRIVVPEHFRSIDCEKFQIFIKTLTGKTITIETCSNALTIHIMDAIAKKEGVPIRQQRLLYAGKQLKRDNLIKHYKITKQSTLHLVLRMTGC